MRGFVRSSTYARVKTFNGIVFIGIGCFILYRIAFGAGMRFEAIPGYVLGLAFIGLGIIRLRGARALK